jgi:hypothetical protein
MIHSTKASTCRLAVAVTVLSCALVLGKALAQDTSTSSTQTSQSTVTTEVKSGTIVYVSGNDVVVKLDDGTVKHVVVPDTTTITVDGKDLTVHDLQPGMKVTRTITTTTTPKTVQTIRTVKGKVWYVNPPHNLILSFPDGTNKQYNVPDGAKFDIDGQKQSIFHVRKGMVISATLIKDVPENDVASTRSVSGEMPPPPPETPAPMGVLLIEAPAPQPATNEVAENTLPKTGSLVPLVGLLGLLSLAASLGLRCLRS